MPRLLIPRMASLNPMGMQRYDEELRTRAADALPSGWVVRDFVCRPIRSSIPGDRRLPHGLVSAGRTGFRRAVGRVVYPAHDLCHRLSLDLPPSSAVEVVTVHDVAPWIFPDEVAPIPAAASELRRAAAVVTVSEFSADEIVRVLGVPRPHVIPNGVDESFLGAVPLSEPALRELGIQPPFVLAGGGTTTRKNLAALADAWRELTSQRMDLRLVLTGAPDERRNRLFAGLDDVVLPGRLPGAVIPQLMAAASALVVPSRYEGFGLPVLEGMAAGVPVVAADASALPEVAGGAAVLVPPTGPGLADGIRAVLRQEVDVAGLVAAGRQRAQAFTWDASARAHARLWQQVLGVG